MIGRGYVGLPLVLLFEEAGVPVLGFDVDTKRGKCSIGARPRSASLDGKALPKRLPREGFFDREPDLNYIRVTAEAVNKNGRSVVGATVLVVGPSAVTSGSVVFESP